MNAKKALFYISLLWRPVLISAAVFCATVYYLTYKLTHLTVGYSHSETTYFSTLKLPLVQGFRTGAFLPFFAINKLLLMLGHETINWLRYSSVAGALVLLLVFFLIIKSWYTLRVALLTTGMLLTSSWFLIVARNATSEIFILLIILSVLLCRVWLLGTKKHKLALLLSAVSLSMLIYVPAGGLLLSIGIALHYKIILRIARTVPFWYAIMCLIVFIVITSGGLLQLQNMVYAKSILGLPNTIPNIKDMSLTFIHLLGGVFWNSNLLPLTNSYANLRIGAQSLLDIFSITMFVAGLIVAIKKYKLSKNRMILILLPVLFAVLSLGAAISASILLPFIYITIASGIAWILQQWFTVFPKNPVARNIGLVLVIATVSFSGIYNSYRYFVAWPHMDYTVSTYNRRP